MLQEDLRQLIERLQQLHIQRENISAEERRILREINQPFIGDDNAERPTERAVVEDDNAVVEAVTVEPAQDFQIGQHVYITNTITHTGLVRRATHADRAAVVTHFTNLG